MKGEQSGKFFVTGLPRSRTAWMAAFLSTGETLCYHEPSYKISKIDQLPTLFDSTFYKHLGISDSGLGFHIEWILENVKPRTLIIERDVEEVKASLKEHMGVPMEHFYYCELLHETLAQFRNHPLVKWVSFNSLVHKRVMQDIYWWLMPGSAFDEERWEQFANLHIEVDLPKIIERTKKYHGNMCSLFESVNQTLADLARESA